MLDAAPLRAAIDVDAAAQAPSSPLARVEVHRDPSTVLEIWQKLEEDARVSPYQTRAWLLPWLETRGKASAVSPFVVVAYDRLSRVLALLPLGLWCQRGLTIVGFLGGRDSNFNLGLFRPGIAWNRAAVLDLLRRATVAAGVKVDLFVFRNQPHSWDNEPNPMASLPRQPSPSFAYKVTLTRDPDEHFKRHLSRDARKKRRQKTGYLNARGPTEHRMARSPAEAQAILDAFVAQRIARSTTLGLSTVDLPNQRQFLERASLAAGQAAAVELHALYCGDRILATFGGAAHQNRFCGMVMSFDQDPELLRTSPGEILLASLIETKCREGIAVFDLGIGEARYKTTYTPDPEILFDSVVALSSRGKLFAAVEKLRLQAKRSIKQSAWAWKVVQTMRRTGRALSRGVAHRSGRDHL